MTDTTVLGPGFPETPEIELRVYVVDHPRVYAPEEFVLCQYCWPEREEWWRVTGTFFDYVADANPAHCECYGCVHD